MWLLAYTGTACACSVLIIRQTAVKAFHGCAQPELCCNVCRSGNPLIGLDLERVSVDVARAIVVLATAESPERSDARVLRIVLSLMGVHDRLEKAGRGGLQVLPLPSSSPLSTCVRVQRNPDPAKNYVEPANSSVVSKGRELCPIIPVPVWTASWKPVFSCASTCMHSFQSRL